MKINSRHTFPSLLDLDPYTLPESRGIDGNRYRLQGILVHSGDTKQGHYRAFLRPSVEETWYEFDDHRVSKKDYDVVLRDSVGVDGNESSAYMLIYVREDQLQLVLDLQR